MIEAVHSLIVWICSDIVLLENAEVQKPREVEHRETLSDKTRWEGQCVKELVALLLHPAGWQSWESGLPQGAQSFFWRCKFEWFEIVNSWQWTQDRDKKVDFCNEKSWPSGITSHCITVRRQVRCSSFVVGAASGVLLDLAAHEAAARCVGSGTWGR